MSPQNPPDGLGNHPMAPYEPPIRVNFMAGRNWAGLRSLDPLIRSYYPPDGLHYNRVVTEEFKAHEVLRAELPRYAPHLWQPWHADVLADFWHTCDRMRDDDDPLLATCRDYIVSASIEDEAFLPALGITRVGGGTVFTAVVVRLAVAQRYFDYFAGGRPDPDGPQPSQAEMRALRVNTMMFMEQHLLAVAYLQRGDVDLEDDEAIEADLDWLAAVPHWQRTPWLGQLPDLTGFLLNLGNIYRTRHGGRGDVISSMIHLFVHKQQLCRCLIRNVHTIIMQAVQVDPHVLDLVIEVLLIVLLGNFPQCRHHMRFATRVFLASNFLLMLSKPRGNMASWFTFNKRLVFYGLKAWMLLNLDEQPALRTLLHTHRNYEGYTDLVYGVMDEVRARFDAEDWSELTPGAVRERVRTMGPGATPWLDGACQRIRETLKVMQARVETVHEKCNKMASKLRKSDGFTKLATGMRGQLFTVETVMQHGIAVYEERAAPLSAVGISDAKFPTDLRNAALSMPGGREPVIGGRVQRRFLMRDKSGEHPVLSANVVEAIYEAAAAAACETSGWPMFEYLLPLGVAPDLINRLFTIYAGFDGYDSPDYQARKLHGVAFALNPRDYCIAQVFFSKVCRIRSVQVDLVAEDTARAQEAAVRQRYGVPLGVPVGNQADFLYCGGCHRVYNEWLEPSRQQSIGSQVIGMRSGVFGCLYSPFVDEFICGRACTPECAKPLIRVRGIGASISMPLGKRFQICCRCGAWTTHDPARMTTHGVACGCEERALPRRAPSPWVRPDLASLRVLREYDATIRRHFLPPWNARLAHPCFYCNTPAETRNPVTCFVHDDEKGGDAAFRTVYLCNEHQSGLASLLSRSATTLGIVPLSRLRRHVEASMAQKYRLQRVRLALASLDAAEDKTDWGDKAPKV